MGHSHPHKIEFYGSAVIGTKGQLVIPIEAREDLGLSSGTKVVVIGVKDHGMVGICPVEKIEQMLSGMRDQLQTMADVLEKTKQQTP